jgi:hypothetical protein
MMSADYLCWIRLSGFESEGSNLCNLVAQVYAAAGGRHLERHPEVVVTSRAKQIEVRSENATMNWGVVRPRRSAAGLLQQVAAVPICLDSLEGWRNNSCLGSPHRHARCGAQCEVLNLAQIYLG